MIAEEVHTTPRLSSTAWVSVSVLDVNDNAPQFPDAAHFASAPEAAAAGARLGTLRASDRDTGRYAINLCL